MTDTEYDCLNRIRHAMKMYLRWSWEVDDLEWQHVHDAMSCLEHVLWVWVELRRHPKFL